MKSLDLNYERNLWTKGSNVVCGMDEVGRGAFSGPVVVACVGFSSDTRYPSDLYIHDSKKLTQKRREKAYQWIIDSSLCLGIGETGNAFIDKWGISRALNLAKQKAYDNAVVRLHNRRKDAEINQLLIDGNDKYNLKGIPKDAQTNLIRGDSKVFSIACASIIAKVCRDAHMYSYSLHPKYNMYNWSQNKGYGTGDHIRSIKLYGASSYHRMTYISKYV